MKQSHPITNFLFSLCCVLGMLFALPGTSSAKTAKEIDASVDAAMARFYQQVDGAREFTKMTKAMLVLPGVTKVAFIIGGEYGEGALRIDGKDVGYYSIVSGSYGFQIGAQAKDIIIGFMTEKALRNFLHSEGWEAGVDGNIALWDVGKGKRLDTTTLRDPIVGFVFGVKGLMADISLKGSKITKLKNPK